MEYVRECLTLNNADKVDASLISNLKQACEPAKAITTFYLPVRMSQRTI